MNDPFFEEIWQEYHTVRLSGNKKKATKMLSHIIRYLNEKDYVYRKKLVKDICTRFFESADSPIPANNGYDISLNKNRIQHPLFREILVPVLIQEYLHKNALFTRWIGQFEQFFFSDKKLMEDFLIKIDETLHYFTVVDKKTGAEKIVERRYFETKDFFLRAYQLDKNEETYKLTRMR